MNYMKNYIRNADLRYFSFFLVCFHMDYVYREIFFSSSPNKLLLRSA